MKASRRQTTDGGDGLDDQPSQQRRMTMRDQASVAQHSTITTDTLASFLADPGKHEWARGIQDAEMVSTLRRKQKEEAGAAIQALNQFIFAAGHTFKGRQLDESDQKQLCDAAQQVGLSLDVVHALIEQTSDPNAILHYCLASSDAFATRMKNDPQLSLLLQQNARNIDRNGFDVADSVWRIFMHKIIQQFLKDHDMQLSDVMTKESLTRRLYEEAMRNEKKSSVDYGNDQFQIVALQQRDYTKERERVKISEEEAKLARQQAEANMSFPIHRSMFGLTTRDSEDYFVSSDQIMTTDDMLSLRPGIYPSDDVSITASSNRPKEADQSSSGVDSFLPPTNTPKVRRRRKPSASDGEEEVSAVKRGLAMFEKSQATPQKDTQRPPRKSLEMLKQSSVQASKATFEGGLHETKAAEQSQYKSGSRESLTGLRDSTVLKSKEKFEGNQQKPDSNGGRLHSSHVRSITNKLSTNSTSPFVRPGNKDQINVQKPERSPADKADVTPSRVNLVRSARDLFERQHAGETSEGESKPGRTINSSSDRKNPQKLPPQLDTPPASGRLSTGDPSHDPETWRHSGPLNHQFLPESFLDRPDYVVVQAHSEDSNGVISALTQSASSSPDDDRSKISRRSSKGRTRRKSRPLLQESNKQGESSVSLPRSMRELIAEMNEGLMRQDMIGHEQSRSDFATETTESHPGFANNSFLRNNNTSTDDSMLSKPRSKYEENHSQNFEEVSRSKHSGTYRESRQDRGDSRSRLTSQRGVPYDRLLSARADEETHFVGENGWVEFDNGFIQPPRTASFGGRSGRGLSEGDNDSLRQPSDKKIALKTESTNILSEIRGVENGAVSGKKEETRTSLVEQAENWSRRVRTLLSDEEQPSTPRFHKLQRDDDPSIFRDSSRINLGNKENGVLPSITGAWTNFENSPFVEKNITNPGTESKSKAQVDKSTITLENRPHHHLNRSFVSTSNETKSRSLTSSFENTTPVPWTSADHSVTRDMAVSRTTSERANKYGHGMLNDFHDASSVVVWSRDTHHGSHEANNLRPLATSRGMNFEKQEVFGVGTSDEIYGDTSQVVLSANHHHAVHSNDERGLRNSSQFVSMPSNSDLPKSYKRTAGNEKVEYNKNSNQYLHSLHQEQSFDVGINGLHETKTNPSKSVDWSTDRHQTLYKNDDQGHAPHVLSTSSHSDPPKSHKRTAGNLNVEDNKTANQHLQTFHQHQSFDGGTNGLHEPMRSTSSTSVVWVADHHQSMYSDDENRPRYSPHVVSQSSYSDPPKSHKRPTGTVNSKSSHQHYHQFRQEQSFDGGLNGLDGTIRSMSSESDFDAVNAYNERDTRRIENIQAAEHIRMHGTSTVPLYAEHDSPGRSYPQQPIAPLLSNQGSRASDIFGHRSRIQGADTLLPASVVEVKHDLGHLELNSLPTSITASNLDSTARHGVDIDEDMDCRHKLATKCQMGEEDTCEYDPNKGCTIVGVAIVETSFTPMNGGPPTTVPVRSENLHRAPYDWSGGHASAVGLHGYSDQNFEALNAYLESYQPEGRTSRGNAPPCTPTGLIRTPFASHAGQRSNGLNSHHQSERAEASVSGNKASSPSLSEILQSNTASIDDDNRDDVPPSSHHFDSRDRYLDAEPGFDENVQAPTSPTQLRSNDSDSMVDEDDFRRAAERKGLSPDLVEILISRSNNKIRRAPLKGADELIRLDDNHRHHEVPIDSDTCRPASARHLRKDVGPEPYVFEHETSWNETANDEYNVANLPPDCPPPDPSPGEAQAMLAALQESAAEAYYNRRASLQSVPGMPELPEGASEEELNLLNRFIEVAASNFDGKKLSAESEKRVRAAAEKVGLSQKFVDQLLDQANANNEARNKAAIQSPILADSVGVPTSPLYDDLSTYYTNDRTQFTKRPNKRSRDVGCNAWESWEQLTNMVRQWANCGAPGDVQDEEENYRERDDGSTIESEDPFRDESTKKMHKARRSNNTKKHRTRKSMEQRGYV